MPRKPKPARPDRRQKKLAGEELYQYAVKSLAARARSVAEMRAIIGRRAAKADEVGTVMARLKERGYVNDERFAQTYATLRLENERFGRVRVAQDLRARRVAPEVAERAARTAYDGVNEAELLDQHLAQRLRVSGPPQNPKKAAALYRALRRAGFSHSAVLSALRRLKADAEVIEALDEEPE